MPEVEEKVDTGPVMISDKLHGDDGFSLGLAGTIVCVVIGVLFLVLLFLIVCNYIKSGPDQTYIRNRRALNERHPIGIANSN